MTVFLTLLSVAVIAEGIALLVAYGRIDDLTTSYRFHSDAVWERLKDSDDRFARLDKAIGSDTK